MIHFIYQVVCCLVLSRLIRLVDRYIQFTLFFSILGIHDRYRPIYINILCVGCYLLRKTQAVWGNVQQLPTCKVSKTLCYCSWLSDGIAIIYSGCVFFCGVLQFLVISVYVFSCLIYCWNCVCNTRTLFWSVHVTIITAIAVNRKQSRIGICFTTHCMGISTVIKIFMQF